MATALVTIGLAASSAPRARAEYGGDTPKLWSYQPPPWLELRKLDAPEARFYMSEALRMKTGIFWPVNSASGLISCGQRINKTRIRCQRIEGEVGGFDFIGAGEIWYSKSIDYPWRGQWNYSLNLSKYSLRCGFEPKCRSRIFVS
jgi:hypothetical protein